MNNNSSSNTVLSLKNVGYYYNKNKGLFRKEKNWALKDVSFEVFQAETLGIIGRNGVGKSTLLRLMAGIVSPDKGQIIDGGYKSILLSLQAGFIPHLSGIENTYLNGMILGMKRKEISEKIVAIKSFSGLGDYFYQPITSYSTGMRARLGFSIALAVDADILLIDEVIGVGDGEFRIRSGEKMKEKIRSNATVILVSHIPGIIHELCDRVIWIEDGVEKASGMPQDVMPLYQSHLKNISNKLIPQKGADGNFFSEL